jgi:molybdopterin-containing oxidoreductase family iron-sulfur binding subunit
LPQLARAALRADQAGAAAAAAEEDAMSERPTRASTDPGAPEAKEHELTRRDFLSCVVAGCAAAALGSCKDVTHTELFRSHLKELSKEEIAAIVADLERDLTKRYGKPVQVGTKAALPGVEFGYALDISRCVGCRRCVYASVEENNQSRDPPLHWIRVLEMEKDKGIDFAHADPYYDAEQVPRPGHFYLPVACQHCRDAPCVKTCPTGATWQEDDGIVVIDYDWCIGCRCCMSACPYGARRFNWSEPALPAAAMNPQTHLLGNRPRQKGVVEKCTFCIHRVRDGRYPACVEVCPVGARKFGNLRDPSSEIRYVLENKRVFVLKNELNTRPRFYYFYGV